MQKSGKSANVTPAASTRPRSASCCPAGADWEPGNLRLERDGMVAAALFFLGGRILVARARVTDRLGSMRAHLVYARPRPASVHRQNLAPDQRPPSCLIVFTFKRPWCRRLRDVHRGGYPIFCRKYVLYVCVYHRRAGVSRRDNRGHSLVWTMRMSTARRADIDFISMVPSLIRGHETVAGDAQRLLLPSGLTHARNISRGAYPTEHQIVQGRLRKFRLVGCLHRKRLPLERPGCR